MSDSECSEIKYHKMKPKKNREEKEKERERELEHQNESEESYAEEEYNEEEEEEEEDSGEEESYENEMFQDNNSSCSIDAFEFFSRYLENDQEESIIDVLTSMRDNGSDTRNAILKVAKELHNLNSNINTLLSSMVVDEEEYSDTRQRRSKKSR